MRSTSQPSPKRSDAEIREEAREWFVSLLNKPSAARRAAFEAWRQADPAHEQAFRDVEAAWQAAEQPGQRLAEQETDELSIYLEAMDKAKSEKKTFRRLSTLSILLAFVLAGTIWLERPNLLQNLTADYVTERGERRSITLTDGSTVLLDADSALTEDTTPQARRVRLLRGAAFFDVLPAQTPFIVAAAEGEVRVLGTGFDVRLLDDGGAVTLEHGSVAVTSGRQTDPTILEPGQKVTFGAGGVGHTESVNLDDALAWRGGRFVFYRARLADVVREIERYRKGRIVVATSSLAEERVTGSFPLADTDAALASLQASVGFKLNTVAGRLTVIGP